MRNGGKNNRLTAAFKKETTFFNLQNMILCEMHFNFVIQKERQSFAFPQRSDGNDWNREYTKLVYKERMTRINESTVP